MLKKLLFALFLFYTFPVLAQVTLGNTTVKSGISTTSSKLTQLLQYEGLEFFKDYTTGTIDADFSAGSPTGTYTSSRSESAPMTWMDGNGVINLSTTSNVPLFRGGYYDTTGFHAANLGIISERALANLLSYTDGTNYAGGLWTSWATGGVQTGTPTKTNVAIPELTSITGATSQRYQYTGVPGDASTSLYVKSGYTAVGSFANGDPATFSFYARSQTGNTGVTISSAVVFRDDGGSVLNTTYSGNYTLTSSWAKFSFSTAATDPSTSRLTAYFGVISSSLDNGDTVDFEIACPQVENFRYGTSFTPTTTAALTRNSTVLTYLNQGNSNKDEETIFIKFTPESTWASPGPSRSIYGTNTAERDIYNYGSGGTQNYYWANKTDQTNSYVADGSSPLINTTRVVTSVIKHSSPYIQAYVDGVSKGTWTTSDWTNPAWGSTFYVGSYQSSSNIQHDGAISAIVKFNRALSSTEVVAVTAILNQ